MNSKRARSQNQLHIHMSCIRPAVRDQLHSLQWQQRFDSRWQIVRERFNGHTYYARTLSLDELENRGAIALTFATLSDAQHHPNDLTMLLYPVSGRQFLLLASVTSGASAEWDFQEHRCPELLNGLRKKPARRTALPGENGAVGHGERSQEKNL